MTYIANYARFEGDPKVIRSGPSSLDNGDRLAKALGWFSIGLGLTELIAPQVITRALGMQGKEALLRAYGARELASGMLCLSTEKTAGLWSRVGGDGLDIITLLSAMRSDNPKRENVAAALAMVLGVTVLDVVGANATALPKPSNGDRRMYSDRSGFPNGVEAARATARQSANQTQH